MQGVTPRVRCLLRRAQRTPANGPAVARASRPESAFVSTHYALPPCTLLFCIRTYPRKHHLTLIVSKRVRLPAAQHDRMLHRPTRAFCRTLVEKRETQHSRPNSYPWKMSRESIIRKARITQADIPKRNYRDRHDIVVSMRSRMKRFCGSREKLQPPQPQILRLRGYVRIRGMVIVIRFINPYR